MQSHSLSTKLPLRMSQHRLREAVLLSFRDPLPPQAFALTQLSLNQWKALLPWLDISGLALYLYDRLSNLDLTLWLPEEIQIRLRTNLADNTERMHGMLAESIEIQQRFQQAGLGYVVLKGCSLIPSSVQHLQFRSQLDLDFLVATNSIGPARSILEERGFVLHAVSGRSLEFKSVHTHSGSLRDLYKNHLARSIELHAEPLHGKHGAHIADGEWREICGFHMPVLPPVALFLHQATHLYKHISTGFFRCSHMLELYRHIVARSADTRFWEDVGKAVEQDNSLELPLGVTTLLLTQVMGSFAPEILTGYSSKLSAPVRIWTEKIGPRCVFSNWPGTKLYLLLQRELADDNATTRSSLRRALIPCTTPPSISPTPAVETVSARLRRSTQQTRYVFFRLRYHLLAGLQYAWELARWKRQMSLLRNRPETPSRAIPDMQTGDISETNKEMTIL